MTRSSAGREAATTAEALGTELTVLDHVGHAMIIEDSELFGKLVAEHGAP